MKRRFSSLEPDSIAVEPIPELRDSAAAAPTDMAVAAPTTPPPLQGVPSAKEKKYDRQLRLWAASGQAALEEAHLLLVNSGPGVVGVEALKNLVLPGIGHFTILDDKTVVEDDLGVNFFLQESSLGRSRAEETCKYLQELNPDVAGNAILESASDFISKEGALDPYSIIVVAAPIDASTLQKFLDHGESKSVPVFYIHSVGFYSCFCILVPQAFPIVDTHPDPATTADLRLLKPWPALLEYAKRKTEALDAMDDQLHGHVPYLLLILYYLGVWKKKHDGKLPANYREKDEFKKLLNAGMRMNNAEGGEENYEQGVAAVFKNLNEPVPSSAVKDVFNASECTQLTPGSSSFWIIAQAISRFYHSEGVLPLPGSVPDMKAISSDYVELQNVYKSKARQDVQTVTSIVRSIEKELNRSDSIADREIEAFCKGAAHIKLIRGKAFPTICENIQELLWGSEGKRATILLKDETSGVQLFIAFLAYDAFYQSSKLVPGLIADNIEQDKARLTGIANEIVDGLLKQAGKQETEEITAARKQIADHCHELTRAGIAELHNISSLAGGLVAQEIIKVITKQYIPVDNICLFDGIKSVAMVLKL